MEMNYCRRCGSKLSRERGHVFACEQGHKIYANSSPTVGIFFVTPNKQIVLAKRAIEPLRGWLDSIGGFLDGAETFEMAAAREIKEEIGLSQSQYGPLNYLYSSTGAYDFGGEIHSIVNVFFWVSIDTIDNMKTMDDVAELVCIDVSTDTKSLQIDQHVRVALDLLIERMRNNEI